MQIGSYQVLFELGRGGMGTVYLGRVRGSGDFERLVAIKRQQERRNGFDEPPERFLTEARLAGLVHHANVVGIHQSGRDEEGYYFVCDYVEGPSLAGLVSRNEPHSLWPGPIVTRVMLDALAGLQAVHDAVDAEGRALGMLHRDVAIDNLLVGRDGVTRLADFGIAKTSRSSLSTDVGQIRGKLPYLAPEYLRAEAVDKTFDVYAAGITLWVALTGELPWGDRSEVHVMQAILSEGVPRIAKEGRSCAPALDALIARACHHDARDRFQSAREMLDALELAAASAGGIASHVQVAEYVERVAGQELAARRARIQARRRELDAEPVREPAPVEPAVRAIHAVFDAPTVTAPAPSSTLLARRSTLRAPSFAPSAPTFTPPAPTFTSPAARAVPVSSAPTASSAAIVNSTTGARVTTPAASFAPPPARFTTPTPTPTPSFSLPTPRVAMPTPMPSFARPALRFTPPTPRPSGSALRFTPPAPRFTPPAARSRTKAARRDTSTPAEPVRLPMSPALPRVAWAAALLLLLLAAAALFSAGKSAAPATISARAASSQ